MRKFYIIFALLILVAVGFGVSLIWWEQASQAPVASREPAETAASANQPKADAKTAAEAAEESEQDRLRPTFDIVRAESDGSVVMAGRAPAEWIAIVTSNGREIGRKRADAFGEWVIDNAKRLSEGEHSLELKAVSPEGEKTLFSKQRLALSMSDPLAGQPLVALTEEDKATRVLQMPSRTEEQTANVTEAAVSASPGNDAPQAGAPVPSNPNEIAEAAALIGFSSVDYEDAGAKSMLFMSGHAKPDSRVALFVNDKHVGTVNADATGSWTYDGNRTLGSGRHVLRADLLAQNENDNATDKEETIARAEVNFERAPEVVSALFDDDEKLARAADFRPGGAAAQAAASGSAASGDEQQGKVIVIQNGDTLWQIAQRHYGDGAKYTQIFRNNRIQIRDPNWIYPQQRLQLP